MVFGSIPSDFIPFYIERGVDDPMRYAGILLGTTVFVFVAMWRILTFRRIATIGLGRVILAAVAGVLLPVLITSLLRHTIFFNLFGLIQMLWNGLNFAFAPVALLALASTSVRRRTTLLARCVLGVALLIWPGAVYAHFIEPFRLQVERFDLSLGDRSLGGPDLRIGVLSDLQTDRITAYERHVVDSLMAEKPDLILIPGDLFQGTDVDLDAAGADYNALLARLDAPLGVYFATGDVDPQRYVERLIAGTKVQWLDNRIVELDFHGRKIDLCGVAIALGQHEEARRVARRFMQSPDPNRLRLAFAHHPDEIHLFGRDPGLDLFVSGHTHGGQIALPFHGPLLTLSSLPREIGAGGLHRYHERNIYVSRGAGMERSLAPRIRFLVPPEIAILTVKTPRKEP